MQVAYIMAPFQVRIADEPVPQPGPGQVLLRVRMVGICGTDIHLAAAWARDWQRFGHETVADVVALGAGVTDLTPGQRVTVQASIPCGLCADCLDARPNDCARRLRDSLIALAEYITVDRRYLWPLGAGLPLEAAVLIEPLMVALDVVHVADIDFHHDVVLVGPGPIGLMALRLARLKGARRLYVVGTHADAYRFPLCRDLGADACIDIGETDPVVAIRELTGGRGVHRALITAPPVAVPSALEMLSFGGIASFVGFSDEETDGSVRLDLNRFHWQRLQLRASFAGPARGFPTCEELLRQGHFPVDRFITHRFPLASLEQALRLVAGHADGVVKAVIDLRSE